MCGIAGIITAHPLSHADTHLAARLSGMLAHRGPDGEGEHGAAHAMLVMRRLSILDLEGGWQPLYNENRTLALVCNGEVYNHLELRTALEAAGHRFRTRSDCETILHLYEEHGDECVHRLRGMYAFALWDARRNRLLLCRDRMGEKPLYLVEGEGRVVFASELKAVIGAGAAPFELDPDAVHLYYHYGYVPEPRAAVRGVRKLPAGHVLAIELQPWRVSQRCYWRMEDAPPVSGDPATLIRQELDRISELVIQADVPVGVALSGGLDSSAIATLAASKYPGAMHAISLGYAGRPLQDERADARALARHLGMPFHEIELGADDVVALMPEVAWHRDDPIADISGPSYYSIMKKAREAGVPVMLAGQGGDELFWGYRWVREAARATRRKQRLRSTGSAGLGEYLRITRPPWSYTAGLRWAQSLGGLRSGWRQRWRDAHSSINQMVFYELEPAFAAAEAGAMAMYTPDFGERITPGCAYDLFTIDQPWPDTDVAITRLICQTYLLENGIAQGDRLSMASSVELRLPLVDYRLAELVIGLRKAASDLHAEPKRWLRDAVADVVPEFVRRRPKRGFTPPWREWSRAGAAAHGHLLPGGSLVQRGVLEGKAAARLARRLHPTRFSVPLPLADFSLSLELWCRAMESAASGARAHHREPARP